MERVVPNIGLLPTNVFPTGNLVLSDGPSPCDWMFIGEAPGYQEHMTGRPMVGPAGRLLNRLLEYYTQLRRNNVYITNVCKHRPPDNATPKLTEARKYLPYLMEEIAWVQPKVIITIGAVAAHIFDRKLKMLDEHGVARLHCIENVWEGVWVPWWHTAYALRLPNIFEQIASDAARLHDGTNRVREVPLETTYRLGTEGEVVSYLLKNWQTFGFDTETTSPERMKVFMTDEADMVGYSVSFAPGHGLYIPTETVGTGMKMVLESGLWHKICHNAKFEYKILKKQGIELLNYDDTRICASLLGENRTGLKTLTKRYLGVQPIEYNDITRGKELSELAPDDVAEYASGDADHTLRLWPMLHGRVQQEELTEVYQTVELPLTPVLARMETKGMLVDAGACHDVLGELMLSIKESTVGCMTALALAGANLKGFNLNSNDQLEQVLMQLGAPLKKKTASGDRFSVDAVALESVRDWSPKIIDALLTYKKLVKLTTYAQGFLGLRGPDGRLHTSFNQCGRYEESGASVGAGTATGRISSSGPNLQNVPHHRANLEGIDWGRELRKCVVAAEGFTLLSADLGQEEPRIVAVLADDQTLINSFSKGKDIYRPAAEALYPHTATDDTDDVWKRKWDAWERFIGKTFFLAWYYGAGAGRLKDLDPMLTSSDARRGLKLLTKAHPARQVYIDQTTKDLQELGYVTSLYGRKRWISKVWSPKKKEREEALREAANMRVQATAADILKLALPRIDGALSSMWSALVSTVHDEVIIEAHLSEVTKVKAIVEKAFEGLLPTVPLVLETFVGQRWADREQI